ncbi:MAG: DUF2029 domain-containing protein [Minwuiales bacterium]|nr:DUF2029 domain-containing protein [Minwuiales bacterium]
MSDIGRTLERREPSSPPLRLNWLIAATLLGCGAVLYIGFYIHYLTTLNGIFDASNHPVGRDFLVFWSAAKLTAAGQVALIFDPYDFYAAQQQLLGGTFPMHNWSYPPQLLLPIRPFGWLPYISAYLVWLALGLSLYLFVALRGDTPLRRLMPVAAAALFLAPSSFVNIVAGQNGFFAGALFIGGMLLVRRHPLAAGVLFGLLTFKPQLGVLIPVALIALRQWKPFVSAILSAGAIVALSVAVEGAEVWRLFVVESVPFQARIMGIAGGFFTWMMPTVFMAGRLLGFDPALNHILQLISGLAAVVATYWAFRTSRDLPTQLAVISIATFLVVPYAFNYDMTIVAFGLACYAVAQADRGFLPFERLVLALLWALPFLVMPFGAAGLPLGPLVLWLGLGFVLWHIRLDRAAPPNRLTP